jgi:hypothetical protein
MKQYDTIKTLALMVIFFGLLLMPMADAQQMGQPGQMPPAPEIEVTSITFSDTDAIEGQEVTITITIENMNSTMKVENITLSLYLDYEIVQNYTDISLASGETATYDYVYDSESGTHNVTAMLVINEMPLPDTQTSEELDVGLGDIGSILIAFVIVAMVILVIIVLPSIVSKIRP